MPNTEEGIESQITRHRELAKAMPHAWNAFFAGFGTLRPVQLEAMPTILTGRNVLVTAPTAGGKTEAVMAPIAEKIAAHRWPGLSVLVVTPTRALVNDLYQRLEQPLGRMRIPLARKTSDHPLAPEVREHVVVTTPESIESLLSLRRERLNNVQVVVLDEIHLLDGTPRGDQLRCLLKRLAAYRHHVGGEHFGGLQLVALSATVSDPKRLALTYLGDSAGIVQVAGQRALESKVILAVGDDQARAEAAIDALDAFPDAKKILVFVNSRKQVDVGASYFRTGKYSTTPVYGHHGSLSKNERERTETRFKQDPQAICVATMTLEVGIDIGDVDIVICMDPPFSLASFLQRIGRGCRRLAGLTRVLCVARDRAGELMFQALVRQASRTMPQVPTPPFRRSVLVQQILAYLKQVPRNARLADQFTRVLESEHAPAVPAQMITEVLQDLCQEGTLSQHNGVYQPASTGWSFIESNKLFGNIQANPLEVALVDVDSGNIVARVRGVNEGSGGVRVAGRSYEILAGNGGTIQRVRGGGQHEQSPTYFARSLPYSADIGASLANMFGVSPDELVDINVGNTHLVMTWLGKLWNAALSAELTRNGFNAAYGSFHLAFEALPEQDVLTLLKQTISGLLQHNPLGELSVERMVDVGPHLKFLSPHLQMKAKEDWLDGQFLKTWVESLVSLRQVSADTPFGSDLLTLT